MNREQLWTLTEARVTLVGWRWKYNRVRPHRPLGHITPLKFAQKDGEQVALNASWIYFYHWEQLIHPARLTRAQDQFGHLDQHRYRKIWTTATGILS